MIGVLKLKLISIQDLNDNVLPIFDTVVLALQCRLSYNKVARRKAIK